MKSTLLPTLRRTHATKKLGNYKAQIATVLMNKLLPAPNY
jgi:hypothetical protein